MVYLTFFLRNILMTFCFIAIIFIILGIVIFEIVLIILPILFLLIMFFVSRAIDKRTVKIHYVKKSERKKRFDQVIRIGLILLFIISSSLFVYDIATDQPGSLFLYGMTLMLFSGSAIIQSFLRWQ